MREETVMQKIEWGSVPLTRDPKDIDVAYLGFTMPVTRALRRGGIVTVHDLSGRPWRHIKAIKGVGTSTVKAIVEELWRIGIPIFDEDDALRDSRAAWLYEGVDFETRGDTAANAGQGDPDGDW